MIIDCESKFSFFIFESSFFKKNSANKVSEFMLKLKKNFFCWNGEFLFKNYCILNIEKNVNVLNNWLGLFGGVPYPLFSSLGQDPSSFCFSTTMSCPVKSPASCTVCSIWANWSKVLEVNFTHSRTGALASYPNCFLITAATLSGGRNRKHYVIARACRQKFNMEGIEMAKTLVH